MKLPIVVDVVTKRNEKRTFKDIFDSVRTKGMHKKQRNRNFKYMTWNDFGPTSMD